MTSDLMSIKDLSKKLELSDDNGEIAFENFTWLINTFTFHFNLENNDNYEKEQELYDTIGLLKTYALHSNIPFAEELLIIDKIHNKAYKLKQKVDKIKFLIDSQEDLVKRLSDSIYHYSKVTDAKNILKELSEKFIKFGSKLLIKDKILHSKLNLFVDKVKKSQNKTKEEIFEFMYNSMSLRDNKYKRIYEVKNCDLYKNGRKIISPYITVPKDMRIYLQIDSKYLINTMEFMKFIVKNKK